jgi:hypothetical protein
MLAEDNDLLFIGGQVKEKIWLAYEKYKNNVHTYMHNPDGRIDRHKVASVMLYSIIANKPFDIKFLHGNEKVKGISLLANETLGFSTALSIVWSFIMEDAEQKCDKNKTEIFKNGFIYPECQHDSYEENIFKMLYYAKHNGCYDIFAFSQVLFLIESYTELVRKNEFLGKIL